MKTARIVIFALLALVLGVPFLMSAGRQDARPPAGAARIIVVTPHVGQIRDEFGLAFSRWHRAVYGEPAFIDYRTPGGTSEIRNQLEAQFNAALRSGNFSVSPDGEVLLAPGAIGFDLMWGGGSFEFDQLKGGIRVNAADVLVPPEGIERLPDPFTVPLSLPAGFSDEQLAEWYGEDNAIGAQTLYDPDQHWLGTALSSFGIVYNKDIFESLGLPAPDSFEDLTVPRLQGWVALADPRQSGSITTTFDSILGNYGWDRGFRILREMSANARYFTASASKVPTDVGAGEAAVGLAIDFYGREQASTVGDDRVGYLDPVGSVYIDADPIALLRGGPNPELARRFIEFLLTDEAQLLWQLPPLPVGSLPEGWPVTAESVPVAPARHALRRMPIKRDLYPRYARHFFDDIRPFEAASEIANPGWRTGVQVMMGAFGIDTKDDLRRAWRALNDYKLSDNADPAVVAEMERLFHAFPETPVTILANLPGYDALSEPARAVLRASGIQRASQLLAVLDALERERTRLGDNRFAKRVDDLLVIAERAATPETPLADIDFPADRASLVRALGVKTAGEAAAWADAIGNPHAAPWPPPTIAELRNLAQEERRLPFTPETFRAVRDEWRDPVVLARNEIRYRKFFRDNYRRIVERASEGGAGR